MPRARLSADALEARETPTTLPPGFAEAAVTAGLTRPTALALAPDGRLFVAEQDGALRVVQNGQLLPAPFAALPVDSTGERGLLGVALDPNFAANGFVYVYHTVPAAGGQPAFNRVTRFTAAGNVAAPGSEQAIVTLDPLSAAANHNGGAIHFGADGKLYVAVGENADPAAAQSLATRHGKILRYNPDGSIPADNPTAFAGLPGTTTGANRAVWAVGLRNPFTFAVQPGTGRLFVNDVGSSKFEEVNDGGAGKNYGWPATEGDFDPAAFPAFTRPLVALPHGLGVDSGVAIAGAAFYNPAAPTFPADYAGDYFFGDLANRYIKRYDPATKELTTFATDLTAGGLVDLDVTPDGDLLYLARGNGQPGNGGIFRIRFARPPQIAQPPADATARPGDAATFAVAATGSAPLTYQWQRNGADVPGATGPTLTLTNLQPADTGARFRVVVRNEFGAATSAEAALTVSADAPPPVRPALAVGAGPGRPPVVRTLDPRTGGELARFDPTTVTLQPPFAGETRVAAADVTGDGVADLVVGAGPGGPPVVVVYDGQTGGVLTAPTVFEASFTGGVYVAAGDLDGDGKADVIVTPDQGGGPRVKVFRVGGADDVIADFFGIEDPAFRGGARAAAGDVNGDGRADLVVAAGFLGGPRVAGWDGRQLAAGKQVKVFADFFAFEETLRNGVFVAAGDVDGDAKADVIFGGGPGGGPRVLVLGGAALAGNGRAVLGNFFAGDEASRDGVRVAAKDLDGDGKADVVAGLSGRVRGYRGLGLPTAGVGQPLRDVAAFDDGFAGPVFVG